MFHLVSPAGGFPPSCSARLLPLVHRGPPVTPVRSLPILQSLPGVSYISDSSPSFVDCVGGLYLFASSTWFLPGIRVTAPSAVITTCTHDDRDVPLSPFGCTALLAAGPRRAGGVSHAGVVPRGEVLPFSSRLVLHSVSSSCSVKQHRRPSGAYAVLLRRLRFLHLSAL